MSQVRELNSGVGNFEKDELKQGIFQNTDFEKLEDEEKIQAPQPQMTKTCSLNDWKRLISKGNGNKKGATYLGGKSNFRLGPSVELESFFVEKYSCLFQILI